MTLSINIADASFTNFVAEVLPHYELANLFLLLGGDAAKSTANYAGDRQPASVIAAPGYAASSCTLTEINGFEGALAAHGSPFTHIVVATTANMRYCGNWLNGSPTQANMLARNTSAQLQVAVDGLFKVSLAMPTAGFSFLAGSHDGSTAKAYVGAGGILSSASAAYAGGNSIKSKFRVGALGTVTGTFEAAAVLSFNAALTDQQVLDVYGYLRRLLATRGVSVA